MLNLIISMNDLLPSSEATPAGDRKSNLVRRNGEMRPTCAQCEAEIVDGHWFERLPGNEASVLLCYPSCALRYFDFLASHVAGQVAMNLTTQRGSSMNP